jgi:phosphatidylglycerophosphatase A
VRESTLHKILATFFGLGYIPKGSGTFGALGALIVLYGLMYVCNGSTPYESNMINTIIVIVLSIVSYFIGVWATKGVQAEWGSDPSKVVIDEACGVWVSLLFAPLTLKTMGIAFVLFRFFDIAKPLGIRKIDERYHNAHGVMLDDVLAGVYSCICLHGLLWIYPQLAI